MTHEVLAIAISIINIAITIVAVARSFGKVSMRLDNIETWQAKIEKTIGNGDPGAFVRRSEWMMMNDRRSDEIREIRQEIQDLRRNHNA